MIVWYNYNYADQSAGCPRPGAALPGTGRPATPGAAHAAGRTAGDGVREMCGADTRRG